MRALSPVRGLPRLLPALLLASGLALAGGCHSDAPIQARGEQYQTPWLMMGSGDLRQSTMVQQPRTYYDESNLLHVVVPVRNTTDQQLYVQYRLSFYDRSGAQVGVPVTNTVTIPARGQVDIAGVSTSPRAEGPMPFRLELSYPRVG